MTINCLRWLSIVSVCMATSALQAQTDTLRQHTIKEVLVQGHRMRSFLDEPVAGATVVDLRMMDDMPRILGNADPMHYTQLLPGIQSNSEFDAGLHIQGCDNQHNLVSIEGIPLYNVQHALGFFSIFNATHYRSMQVTKNAMSGSMPNRLGGMVDMRDGEETDTCISGTLSVGPMSSQGTLRLPLGKKQQLTLSARAAYLNLLYSQWLKFEDDALRYGFDDYNLTWQWWPDSANQIQIDLYHGGDRITNSNDAYAYDVSMQWHNTMAALHWSHNIRKASIRQALYYTNYTNRFRLTEENLSIKLPSSIHDIGWKGDLAYGQLKTGASFTWHQIQPQAPEVNGFFEADNPQPERQYATESSLYADWHQPLASSLAADAGLRLSLYHHQGHTYYGPDPSLSLSYDGGHAGLFLLSSSIRHQYIFRSGFSNVGLPTEFWFAADANYRPQYAFSLSLSHEIFLFDRMLRLATEVYWKHLWHQVEYSGNIFDFLYGDYDLKNAFLEGNGRNYGLNVMLEKRKGRITGWIAYSLGRARRRFTESQLSSWYPANHERIHELNAVGTYRLNQHWSFGATAVFASGTPYTSPRQFYMINNNVISEFGEHNTNRLSPYFRLDLSANYDFKPHGRYRSGLNFSLYNATLKNNDLFYRLKIYKDKFANKPFRFPMPILPSINYYCHF
ncbi:TonB-dependent siderophore receptor [Prevotella sp. E2-28]|uniref:TonB-dependent receptor plug domain-containing protein n=1 Tax=Prevotella sp. E2-28 TaxID=2913620 RepID=UPI001EDA68C7|nr:TonB-dependent receptor [Prevotella sp. E2-28]UKK54042.1 TonB-dependent receptor [Prevotella sp. E2-28]